MAGISVLRRLFSVEKSSHDPRKPPVKVDDAYQSVQDDQPHNPFTEALLLHGHTSSVVDVCRVDSQRFVTVSEDALVIVWDAESGHQLQILRGHTAAVTSALSLHLSSEKTLLMTGSLDGTLRCLIQLGHNLICSGGRDLCLWDRSGMLLDKFDRSSLSDTSDVHSLLRLDTAHLSIVAASNHKCLSVYDIERPMLRERDGGYRFKREQKRRYLNQSHNYPISFLSAISPSVFASGCGGGCIIVWSVHHLSALKIFHCLPQLQARELTTVEFTKVSCIEAVGERYVFAAVGCGFKMFDVLGQEKDAHDHPRPLVSHTCAHLLPLTYLTFLQDRAQLVTVAEDRMVRLWGSAARPRRDGDSSPQHLQGKPAIEMFIGGGRKGSTVVPLLLGEMYLHPGIIKSLISLEEHGLVTGAEDGSVILWKDGEKEREKRDRDIHSFILGQSWSP